MKIYTRTGDTGTTSLFSGGRVRKDHLRVEAYGTVDELNSYLGVIRASEPGPTVDAWLEQIQNQLFHLGADLATPLESGADWITRIAAGDVAWLETSIDQLTDELDPLTNFILPGGTIAAAHVQVARTICRRAERHVVTLAEVEALGDYVVIYRLSDYLFTLARWVNKQAGVPESRWVVRS